MRFKGVALVTSAIAASAFIGACGGGASKDAAPAASSTPAAAAPAAAAAPGGAVAALPITGKTWEVKMIGDGNSYKFEPADLTIKEGDGIKF
ncbi:MAG TPA: hypothetical protein VN613_05305, partial [Gemmatimonadaceae bacterium]|nr:hypothetical protein [Gemmatimonadaceae bacterium]